MKGRKWDRTCEAVHAFVGLLGSVDRVSITLFESGYRDFAEAPMPAPRVMVDSGFQRMRSLGTDGGTELLPAATHVLQQIASHSAGHRTTVVLITDGQVGNDQLILKAFQQVPHVRVHTFGIDTAVNDAFLKSLARQQRGGCWLQTPDDDIAGTIAALGDRLRRPVLTELSVQGAWESGSATWPDLHVREIVMIALRGTATSPLAITGRLPDGSAYCFPMQLGTVGSEAVKLLWAKERISALLAADLRLEAIKLARQHNLICEGAAFIAWDDAEQIQVAQHEIVQPALEPHVMHFARAAFCAPKAMQNLFGSDSLLKDDAFGIGEVACIGEGVRHPHNAVNPDIIQGRIANIRGLLQRQLRSESTLAAFVDWALADGTLERLTALERTIDFIGEIRDNSQTPVITAGLERSLREALGTSPGVLINWADNTRRALRCLAVLLRALNRAGTPEPVINHLIAWVMEAGTFDRERMGNIQGFTDSLDHLPFSAGSKAHYWRTFAASTFTSRSATWAETQKWIDELETPAMTDIT